MPQVKHRLRRRDQPRRYRGCDTKILQQRRKGETRGNHAFGEEHDVLLYFDGFRAGLRGLGA
jgi:hypothetical protein